MKNTFKAFAFLVVFFSSALLAQDLKIATATLKKKSMLKACWFCGAKI
ncbi:hypothetical protein [Helicobacter pylori]